MAINMRAIEYNTQLSLMDFICQQAPLVSADYGLSGVDLVTYPAYPKDITKLTKPSIIVQKVHTVINPIGFGSYLGQYEDVDGSMQDASGRLYKISYQIDVVSDSNTHRELIMGMITEGIFGKVLNRDMDTIITLYDYVPDLNNPTEIGEVTLIHDMDVISLSSNDTKDYVALIQFDVVVVQVVTPVQDMVDLSKGFKFTQNIKL